MDHLEAFYDHIAFMQSLWLVNVSTSQRCLMHPQKHETGMSCSCDQHARPRTAFAKLFALYLVLQNAVMGSKLLSAMVKHKICLTLFAVDAFMVDIVLCSD